MLKRTYRSGLAIGSVLAALIAAHGQTVNVPTFNSLSEAEIRMLVSDLAVSNPTVAENLRSDSEMRKAQVESLRQLLAFASQAQKEGLAKDSTNAQELENIRAEVTAVNYDRDIISGRKSTAPFGSITNAQVLTFWSNPGMAKARQERFDKFLRSKLGLLKANNPQAADRELSKEEKDQAKDFFAKVQIYESEYLAKRGTLSKAFNDKVDLQIKLQQAQFLAREFSERAAERMTATDSEIQSYIRSHPEFDVAKKRAKAEQVLARAKGGEDFAKLANEFSEDPGNLGPNNLKLGGIYRDIKIGQMLPEFESAAISLQPGQVFPDLVETDFGYHVIKLDKKNSTGAFYDARHILISTGVSDPAEPDGAQKPIKTYVRTTIETEKEAQLVARLLAENNIQVPDDFVVPVIKSTSTARKRPLKAVPARKRIVARKRR